MVASSGVQEPQRPFWLATQRTLAGLVTATVVGEVAGGQAKGTDRELGIRPLGPTVASRETIKHLVDPLALLGAGELVGDEHDDAAAVTIGGHRRQAALAASHFHIRLPSGGHGSPAISRGGPELESPWHASGRQPGVRKAQLDRGPPDLIGLVAWCPKDSLDHE